MNKQMYLVDIVDTDPIIGLWETWEYHASDEAEARELAEADLTAGIDSGKIIGSFEITNIRPKA